MMNQDISVQAPRGGKQPGPPGSWEALDLLLEAMKVGTFQTAGALGGTVREVFMREIASDEELTRPLEGVDGSTVVLLQDLDDLRDAGGPSEDVVGAFARTLASTLHDGAARPRLTVVSSAYPGLLQSSRWALAKRTWDAVIGAQEQNGLPDVPEAAEWLRIPADMHRRIGKAVAETLQRRADIAAETNRAC